MTPPRESLLRAQFRAVKQLLNLRHSPQMLFARRAQHCVRPTVFLSLSIGEYPSASEGDLVVRIGSRSAHGLELRRYSVRWIPSVNEASTANALSAVTRMPTSDCWGELGSLPFAWDFCQQES